MTDGIGRLTGYGNYGVNGFVPKRNQNENTNETNEQTNTNQTLEETTVDPSKVMDFLSNNNIFITTPASDGIKEVDDATKERVSGYMEQFEMIYGLVLEEFGEEFAPLVMDLVADKLLGISY